MTLGYGAFERPLGHKGRVLISVISVLIKEAPKRSLPLSAPRQHTTKIAIYEAGSGSSPDPETATTLILHIPASRNVQNKFLLLISHLVMVVFITAILL